MRARTPIRIIVTTDEGLHHHYRAVSIRRFRKYTGCSEAKASQWWNALRHGREVVMDILPHQWNEHFRTGDPWPNLKTVSHKFYGGIQRDRMVAKGPNASTLSGSIEDVRGLFDETLNPPRPDPPYPSAAKYDLQDIDWQRLERSVIHNELVPNMIGERTPDYETTTAGKHNASIVRLMKHGLLERDPVTDMGNHKAYAPTGQGRAEVLARAQTSRLMGTHPPSLVTHPPSLVTRLLTGGNPRRIIVDDIHAGPPMRTMSAATKEELEKHFNEGALTFTHTDTHSESLLDALSFSFTDGSDGA